MDTAVGLIGAPKRALALLAAAAFPHHCVICGREGRVVCHACRPNVMSPIRGIFVCPGCGVATAFGARCGRRSCASGAGPDGVIAAAPYANPVFRELLRLYKYERVSEAGESVRDAFAAFVRGHVAAIRAVAAGAVIVPVPMHPFREALRGFNQAEMLADVLARETGRPRGSGVLRRRFRVRAQANLPSVSRRANAAGSVRLGAGVPKGSSFVLVDDVTTTGATLDACAAALKAGGAGTVWAMTFLRG